MADKLVRKLTNKTTGTPIIGADGLVESGNARTIALKRVYRSNPQKAGEYKQFLKDNPEIANDIEGQIRANADKLYASRRPAGKGAAAKAEEPAKAADAKEPVVKAPARSSESELDIMVED